MRTKLRVIVEDPLVEAKYGLIPENVWTDEEPFFLDGPVAERVAIIDRDPETGQLKTPVRWSSKSHRYSIPEDISSPEGIAVSVFGLVLKTLALFEREEILGHKVKWAFNSPQLLVVPNAGIWQNAFYDRYSRSLQCFSFTAPDGTPIHTALSRDIITHETGHAILDGLAPALYDALTPQSLALHEAIGDLTAIVMALQSSRIRDWLIQKCGGRLSGSTPVSQLADQFGYALGLNRPLRDANNSSTMKTVTEEPHDLSRVLTGAFWAAMVQLHNSSMDKANLAPDSSEKERIGKTLGTSARYIRCILFRALDYLPPAEATFADYCRAVLRADEVGYPEDKEGYREILRQEFIRRGIVNSTSELESRPEEEWIHVNLDDVLESEWAAYAFAEKMRKLLRIPPKVPFRLFPRRDVTRRYCLGPRQYEDRKEVVFQVTWEEPEENTGIPDLPQRRSVFHGTTMVFGGKSDGKGRYPLLSCLTTDRSGEQEKARNNTVSQLVQRSQLEIGDRWLAFNSRPMAPRVFGRITENILRLRGTARLLHLKEFES